MRFFGKTVLLDGCAVTVGEMCWLTFGNADVTMTEGTTLENDGHVWVGSTQDDLFDASGTLVNRGEMYLGAPKKVTVPIQNSGTLRLVRGDNWDDQVDVEGVEPVWEQQ